MEAQIAIMHDATETLKNKLGSQDPVAQAILAVTDQISIMASAVTTMSAVCDEMTTFFGGLAKYHNHITEEFAKCVTEKNTFILYNFNSPDTFTTFIQETEQPVNTLEDIKALPSPNFPPACLQYDMDDIFMKKGGHIYRLTDKDEFIRWD